MTYKQIEQLREVRMWLRQLGIPIGIGILYIVTSDERTQAVKNAFSTAKESVKALFSK